MRNLVGSVFCPFCSEEVTCEVALTAVSVDCQYGRISVTYAMQGSGTMARNKLELKHTCKLSADTFKELLNNG